ncbi:MAG: AtuA-related protein [Acidimicrobiales bacterium]
MPQAQLRQFCGARSGDKGDISDLTLFADDWESFELIRSAVSAEKVKEHFASLVKGDVLRYEAPNVLALKFVMHQALGGGGPASLRSDNLGKTFGGALLRMWVEVPQEILDRSVRGPAPGRGPAPDSAPR